MDNDINSPDCIVLSDTTWVLISSILVLSMMPALAFFEAGLLKTTNTVSLITQIMSGAFILCIMWHLFGYTLVFAPTLGGVIGNFQHILSFGVPHDACTIHSPHIPAALFSFFEMMFAAIAPLLITGAFIERMKFKAFIFFIIGWEIFVYYPVAHWIWGKGWLRSIFSVQDFAGGIVVHVTSGVSALVCALVLGQRKGFDLYDGEFPPSNLPLAAIGGTLLWVNWFGFNAGSAMSIGSLAVTTVVTTQRAAVCSGFVWLFISWIRHKPSVVGLLNGVISGLAGITPVSGYINPQYGAVLGIIFGSASYLSIFLLKHKLRIDDALDVASIHGIPSVIGSISLGFFSQKRYNKNGSDGLFFGENSPRLLGVQILAVIIVSLWTALITFLLLQIIDRIFGLKFQYERELDQDKEDHEEQAYSWLKSNVSNEMTAEQMQPIFNDSTDNFLKNSQSPNKNTYSAINNDQ